MVISVKYFASLRERIGHAEDCVAAEQAGTVAEVWSVLHGPTPMPLNVLIAVNMDYASISHAVRDGDEVAFFPPVTGG